MSTPRRITCVDTPQPARASAKRTYSPASVRSIVMTWPPSATVVSTSRLAVTLLPPPRPPTAAMFPERFFAGPRPGSIITGWFRPASSSEPSSPPRSSPTPPPHSGRQAARSRASRCWAKSAAGGPVAEPGVIIDSSRSCSPIGRTRPKLAGSNCAWRAAAWRSRRGSDASARCTITVHSSSGSARLASNVACMSSSRPADVPSDPGTPVMFPAYSPRCQASFDRLRRTLRNASVLPIRRIRTHTSASITSPWAPVSAADSR